jgi:hypothetical protein
VVRGIVHPLMMSSKSGLKREAFLPPPNGKDVSTLRLYYTSQNFCKSHAKKIKIGNHQYAGLATIRKEEILLLNGSSDQDIMVQILGSPINADDQYYGDSVKAYPNDNGLPMHSDIVYNHCNISGEPQTKMRVFAHKLISKAKYFKDPNPESLLWMGGNIS